MRVARIPVEFAVCPAFLVPLLAAYAIENFATGAPDSDRGSRSCPSQTKHDRSRALLILATATLAVMVALVWFARRYPLPNDQWSATAANALWRGLFLVLLVGGAVLIPKLKTGSMRLAVQLGLLAALPFDAFLHSRHIAPTLSWSVLAPGVWTASGRPAAPKLGEGRIMITPEAEQQFLFCRVPDMQVDFTGKRLAEWYNLNLLDQIPKVTGAFTLRPANFDLLERTLYYAPGTRYGQGLLD